MSDPLTHSELKALAEHSLKMLQLPMSRGDLPALDYATKPHMQTTAAGKIAECSARIEAPLVSYPLGGSIGQIATSLIEKGKMNGSLKYECHNVGEAEHSSASASSPLPRLPVRPRGRVE